MYMYYLSRMLLYKGGTPTKQTIGGYQAPGLREMLVYAGHFPPSYDGLSSRPSLTSSQGSYAPIGVVLIPTLT